jgi:hypothetical protein
MFAVTIGQRASSSIENSMYLCDAVLLRVPYRAGCRATEDIPKIQPSCWEENKGRGKLLNAIVRFRVFLPWSRKLASRRRLKGRKGSAFRFYCIHRFY